MSEPIDILLNPKTLNMAPSKISTQMILSKTLRSHQIRTLLNSNQNTLLPKSLITTSIFSRNISRSSQFQHESPTQKPNHNSKKPLEAFFTEAAGLSKPDIEDGEDEKKELKKSLHKLEEELRTYNKDSSKQTKTSFSKPLEALFTEAVGLSKNGEESQKGLKTLPSFFMGSDQKERIMKGNKKLEEMLGIKQLSSDMAEFAAYLHSKGYLKTAILVNNKFHVGYFENKFGREDLKFAAAKFARDHREIHKLLPDKDLKKVAQFGCPSVGRKNVFSAKSMRLFYGIQEETVCNKCVLKESCKFAQVSDKCVLKEWCKFDQVSDKCVMKEWCKFVNQSVWKKREKNMKNMDLIDVMRVVTLYGLEAVPTQLEVPDDVKSAVSRLLKEIVRLSEMES